MRANSSRRRSSKGAAALGVSGAVAQRHVRIRGFDHVALPMQNTDAMVAFYRGLGCDVTENSWVCSVHFGENIVNFHRPATWQCETFTLRAPAAKPPCGDLCFVWEGTPESL